MVLSTFKCRREEKFFVCTLSVCISCPALHEAEAKGFNGFSFLLLGLCLLPLLASVGISEEQCWALLTVTAAGPKGRAWSCIKGGSEVLGKGSSPECGGQHPSPTLLSRWTYCQSFFHPDNGAASAASSRFGLPCPPWPANILHKPMTALLRHKQFRALLFYLGPLIVLWYLDLGAVVLRSSLANSGLASPVSVAYTQLCQRWVWGGSDIALR